MKNVEKQKEIDENFKELIKDDSGKMILVFLIVGMFMSKEELERLSEYKNESFYMKHWKRRINK